MARNLHYNKLPRGCELCLRGLKSILFITGLCNVSCFYCPVSSERRGRDVMYVNDVPASMITIFEEVEACMSMGIAITGGEPTLVIDRVCEIARALKREYGDSFHIHVYTNPLSWNRYRASRLLHDAPLDEVRLHIVSEKGLRVFLRYLRSVRDSSAVVGLEVPVVPKFYGDLYLIVEELYRRDVIEFVNLNELDVSESNYRRLISMGLPVERGHVKGSYELCVKILEDLHRRFPDLSIHLCSSHTKDSIQIRLRAFMRSLYYASAYQRVQDDGTLLRSCRGANVREVLIGRSFKIFEEY
ncbi:MAG: 4Fe-4S cluster-binding domain-containing protein [Crenarchaeota archaeon]|nr:4Fe-4S cluster-binding domain-containing protein [Thermoproteota archaeon]